VRRSRTIHPHQGSEAAIELTDVALAYRLCRNRTPSLQEHIFGLLRRQISYEQHWALGGVSLSVHPGELVAMIGPNGAGKTTLLKVIARVLPPTRGRVIVRGRIAPMIELGAGFNAELTGAENILLYGAVLGHQPSELRRHLADIAAFAELEDYLDVPLRSYSSGMLGRLAFAIATWEEPEVVLVDEVLAVGDESFRQRSEERIARIIGRGAAVVLVTHALEMALDLADRVVWLDHGRVVEQGAPARVIANYRSASRAGPRPLPPKSPPDQGEVEHLASEVGL
jgi:ABC-type polysaccharide/polyol phosphate transport system ATPase subunit